MSERLNIWGESGCGLPSGGLCESCCVVKEIESKWGKNGHFSKPSLTPCNFMASTEGDAAGCKIHNLAPNGCEAYHCSTEIPQVKQLLIAQALQSGAVSANEAAEALKRIK
jgi:hypothetical protein